MALQRNEILIDDIDGTPAKRTVYFGLDGILYRIDLSEANCRRLRSILLPYRKAASRKEYSSKSGKLRAEYRARREVASAALEEYRESRGKTRALIAEQRATKRALLKEGREQRAYRQIVRQWAIERGILHKQGGVSPKIIAEYEREHRTHP